MYRLFYDFEVNGDVLFVLLDPEKKPDEVKVEGDITLLYAQKELVGMNLFHISNIVKIKSKGVIFAPEEKLLAALNSYLSNHNVPLLPSLEESGYEVMKIVNLEEHPLEEKAQIVTLESKGKKYQSVSYYPNLEIGKLVVVAKDGTILYDGSLFHKKLVRNIPVDVSLCSPKELKISNDGKEAFLPEGYLEGEDFFLSERGER